MISLTVGTITGRSFLVDVSPSDTIKDVKRKIEEEEAIPSDAQILIFREKTLSDDASVGELDIREGSRIQLAVQMSGGPGPITRVKKPRKEDSVLFLLCRQNDGLFMLEFHVKDGLIDKAAANSQLYKLANAIPPILLLHEQGLDLSGGDVEASASESKSSTPVSSSSSRPNSTDSSISTATFLSLIDSNSESVVTRPSSVTSEDLRAITEDAGFFNSRRLLNYGLKLGDDVVSTVENLESRILEFSSSLPKQTSENKWIPSKASAGRPIAKSRKSRPATAISIMRLAADQRPLVVVADARPATANLSAKLPPSTSARKKASAKPGKYF
ncbi:hypothetical protein HDU76_001858 [Blyttiomyces sp. JEL0837]|nr:hypothetical protein HDU76_001858 [Blyttiomyces sp. JEL0837]